MLFSRRSVLLASALLSTSAVLSSGVKAHEKNTAVRNGDLSGDALAAWRFFEQGGTLRPGILPATAWLDGEDIHQYPVLTMWDVGSLISGYVSARSLGIITDAEFAKYIDGVLAFLKKATFKHEGHTLLNFKTRASDGAPVGKGFDSTDTGRLLIALKILDRYTGGALHIDKLVAGWNIPSTIRKGKMQDIKAGVVYPATSHLYAGYVSRGYSLWGIEHDPVPLVMTPVGSSAEMKAFLREVREIGSITTEPSVTEAIELGASKSGQVMADVLFEAQVSRFKTTGILTCVSEGPIDRPPWFTYQGYELTEDGGRWSVHAVEDSPKWQTAEFAASTRMLSSKAAYLWAAFRPEPYSELLQGHIREKAISKKLGFSAGIYEQAGRPANVYDINTNSVILEAVAYTSNDRIPLFALTPI